MRDVAIQMAAWFCSVPDVGDTVKTASEVEKLGPVGLLFLVIIGMAVLLVFEKKATAAERKAKEALTQQIIEELKITNSETLKTMIEVQHSVEGHTKTLEAVMPYIRAGGSTP